VIKLTDVKVRVQYRLRVRQRLITGAGIENVGAHGRRGLGPRARDRAEAALDHSGSRHGVPSRALEEWAYRRGVLLDFIRPGKPVGNAFIESFNGRRRDECLNVEQFASVADAQAKIEAWRVDYHQRRPHGSLGHLTPTEFVEQRQAIRVTEEVVFSS
jgi:transposase InsO family protein